MSDDQLKVRKSMRHTPPAMIRVTDAWYFVTICAADRNGAPFISHADVILDAARYYHHIGKWRVALFMVMPDHLHAIVHVPLVGGDVLGAPPIARAAEDVRPYRRSTNRVSCRGLAKTIGDFKSFLTRTTGIAFQPDFFDTRIRDKSHYAEKWRYICNNPVTRGLCDSPRDWPYVIAFDRETGEELPHR